MYPRYQPAKTTHGIEPVKVPNLCLRRSRNRCGYESIHYNLESRSDICTFELKYKTYGIFVTSKGKSLFQYVNRPKSPVAEFLILIAANAPVEANRLCHSPSLTSKHIA